MKKTLITLSFLLLSSTVFADFNKGKEHFEQHDYMGAIAEFEASAIDGDMSSITALAAIYDEGVGVEQDSMQAIKWLTIAANKNDTLSQVNLGSLYYEQGNYEESFKWFKAAADKGNSNAQNNVGLAYLTGKGVEKNYTEALNWLNLSAKNNNYVAMNAIGAMYQKGLGVRRSISTAIKWYTKSANEGNIVASNNLTDLYEKYPHLNPSIQTYKNKAMNGDVYSQISLGSRYMYGTGEPVNYQEALKWFLMAAEKNNAYALANLGSIYLDGYGVPKDYSKAMYYLNRGAQLNQTDCIYNLGVMYRDGFGVAPDEQKAKQLFLITAKRGDINSQSNLGLIAIKNKDYSEAFKWFSLAVKKHDVDSQYNLALMYKDGLGVAINHKKYLKYLKLSAQNPNYTQSDLKRENLIFELAVIYRDGTGLSRPNDMLAYALFDLVKTQEATENKQDLAKNMSIKQIDFSKALSQEMNTKHNLINLLRQYK